MPYEEYEAILWAIDEEQAENSDVGGDSDPEDLLPLSVLPSSQRTRKSVINLPESPHVSQSSTVPPPPIRTLSADEDDIPFLHQEAEHCFDLLQNPSRDIPMDDSPIPISPIPSPAPSSVPVECGQPRRSRGVRTRGPRVRGRVRTTIRGQQRSSSSRRGGHSVRGQQVNQSDPYKFRKIFREPPEHKNHKFGTYSGINVEIDLSSPLKIFMLFFTNQMFQHIVDQSNLYSGNKLNLYVKELHAFFGILIIMGFNVLPSVRHYWSTDQNFFCARISGLMTVKRFLKILRYLHLNDNSTMKIRGDPEYDRLHKVRPLLNMLSENFKKVFSPSRFLSVDESMIPFKGRSMLKQYMPLKPIKRGFKVWVLCCAVTGYMCCMEIYEGKKDKPSSEVGLGEEVVMKLTQTFVGLGFCVYFDRFFNSLCLLTKLLSKQIFACGTLLATRKYFPKERLRDDKDLATGDFDSVMDGSVSITKWKDRGKKCVLMASNMHNPAAITSVLRTNREGRKEQVKCPKSIADYNIYMGGVDRFDQLMASYTVSWKSRRWWLKIFYYLLDCAVVNSYIVYREVAKDVLPHAKRLSHLSFRSKLADELISDYMSRKRQSGITNKPKFVADQPHFPERTTCKRCGYCSTKEKPVRSRIGCNICEVSLCLGCFKDFHLNGCKKMCHQ